MEAVKELFQSVNGSFVFLLIVLLAVVVYVIENLKKLQEHLGIRTKWDLREEQEQKAINELETELDELRKDFVQDCDNRDDYQVTTTDTLNEIKEDIKHLKDSLQTMQDKQDAATKYRIQDRVAQMYRFFHERKEWTEIDRSAFQALLESYRLAGGQNSFIHTTVLPESLTWKIIDKDQEQGR